MNENPGMYQLIATCPDETKDVLCKELEALGCQDVVAKYKAVHFYCNDEQFYRAHLMLRTASNLMWCIKKCSAASPEMIYAQSSRIKWPEFFDGKKTFKVDGVVADRGKHSFSANDLSKKVKEGIWFAFDRMNLPKPQVELKEPDVEVVAFLQNGKMMLSLQTSGMSMHKRGYRSVEGHPAPLKETMAASLLMMAGYDGTQTLFDPMCGSGTIAIEAATLALHKAPLIHRKKGQFAFEHLKMFNAQTWRDIQDDLRLEKIDSLPAPIFASDLSDSYIKYARETALRARVEKYITFSTADFLNAEPPAESGLLVCNLPYGERLSTTQQADMKTFYTEIGDTLKKKYKGWKVALLTADEAPWQQIGLRPKKKISLLNGSIATKLLIYEIFAGRWNEHRSKDAARETEEMELK